ncbi:MAG TPA: POTRA domain-containing protein, partial [Polyangia bacterium]|nr:POTRA domain-containing protein [Polyangia bacterium]
MRSLTLAALILGLAWRAQPARADGEPRLESIELEGRLLEPKEKLLRFLGLVPGAPVATEQQQRVTGDLTALGYRLVSLETGDRGVHWKLVVEPVRVVRNITVRGNWPLFDDEVLRHLTVRSGDALKADDELQEFLDHEAASIKKFLERDGYFGGEVKIIPRQPRKEKHPEWVDLDIRISLGDWYKLGALKAEGNHAVTEAELFNVFGNHCCFRWGRFTIDRMREDARTAEKKLRDRGYPAARVAPDFDFARDANPDTRRITLHVKITEKRKIEVKFFGNRALADRDLREQLTIFSNGAYDEIELADSAKAVQRYYQQHGYFEAKVTFTRKRIGDQLEQVSFLVDEGPELKVRAVEVVAEEGEQLTWPGDEVRARAGVETKVFPTLGVIGLGSGGYVTMLQLKQDADRIAEFYKKRGFPQVKVEPQVVRDPASFNSLGAAGAETAGALDNRDDLYVRFYVHEGPHELVEEVRVEFTSAHVRRVDEVMRVLKMTRGQPVTADA